ncbi:hypothetical protein [Bartonella rattaustraliani]|uniref:hypothetical protein n=1 Tax=Bartonella rattaustraliani TaxID=481139 RepID=UPI0002E67F44|nr:hypothetical protein [Bartonella rattaustraliani]
MIFSLQRLFIISFLLLIVICEVKTVHAEFLYNETFEEKYQRFKERRIVVNSAIEVIKERLDELKLLIEAPSDLEHHKLLHEQNTLLRKQSDLKEEYIRLTLKLNKLAEAQLKLISRMHIAKEYEEGEYEEKLAKTKKYLEKTQLFNAWNVNEDVWGKNEIVKNYLVFAVVCRTLGSMLDSDIAVVLRKDFGWKKRDFIWAKYAMNSIDPKLIKDIRKLLRSGPYNYKKELYDNIKNSLIRGNSFLENVPIICRAFEKVHNAMLPNKSKNIINRINYHVKDWFND